MKAGLRAGTQPHGATSGGRYKMHFISLPSHPSSAAQSCWTKDEGRSFMEVAPTHAAVAADDELYWSSLMEQDNDFLQLRAYYFMDFCNSI